MQPSSVLRWVCLGAIGFTACGTSSSDGGTSDGAAAGDAASQCYPFGSPVCPKGQTCCFSGVTGTCKELGACASTVHFECGGPDGCSPGQLCCATIPPLSDIDASALSQEGGVAEFLAGVTASSSCSTTCPSPSVPVCRTLADCTGGAVCSQLPEGNLVLAVVGAETILVCMAGGVPPSDGGAAEGGGSEGAASDAGGGD